MTRYFHVSYVLNTENKMKFGDCLVKSNDIELEGIRKKILESIGGDWTETPVILGLNVLDKKTFKFLGGK